MKRKVATATADAAVWAVAEENAAAHNMEVQRNYTYEVAV